MAEIHGIRPELQPAALLEQSAQRSAAQAQTQDVAIEDAVGENHDAPGVDQADVSAITGVGSNLNVSA